MPTLQQQAAAAINRHRSSLAAQIVAREFQRNPALQQRYGSAGRERCLEDAGYHLGYLAQAVAADHRGLFDDYVGWAKVMLARRGVPADDLASLLLHMREALPLALSPAHSRLAGSFIDGALEQLPRMADQVPSFISADMPLAALASSYLQALLKGERQLASRLVLGAVEGGASVRDVYLQVFQSTQREVGRLWQLNQIIVAQEHYCTAATQLVMSQLYPHVFAAKKTRGTVVTACVAGDLHELGARMVCDFFEMAGWHTRYLGANVPTPSIVQTLAELPAQVLAVSATIGYHLPAVQALIDAVRQSPRCAGVRILVGGYPFNLDPDLWRKLGADGSAADAAQSVTLMNRLEGPLA